MTQWVSPSHPLALYFPVPCFAQEEQENTVIINPSCRGLEYGHERTGF